MDNSIGVGLIVGLTIASSFFIYDTNKLNRSQKIFLYLCIIFPPAQWLGILILLLYNNLAHKNSLEGKEEKRFQDERSDNEVKLDNLKYLKDQEILTESEYQTKVKTIKTLNIESQLKQSDDYKKLKSLYDDEILTEQEFEEKIKILRDKISNNPPEKKPLENGGLQKLGDFKEGMARIWDEDQQYGFIDIDNKIIVMPKYDLAEDFNEGLAMVMGYGNYGFINKKGDVVIHLQYDDATSFENGVAKVRLGKEEFYIDKTGKEVGKN